MGTRGPKPLPANVHLLRGNASKLPAHALGASVEPAIEIPGIPKHLMPEARKFWRRLTPELEALGLISKIDQAALALVCQEWAWLVWNEQQLQRAIARAEAKRAAWEARRDAALAAGDSWDEGDEYTGPDGLTIAGPNGGLTYNPNWVARNRHATQLDRFLASFGMSPSSRGRVTPSSRQLDLPGIEPKEGFAAL